MKKFIIPASLLVSIFILSQCCNCPEQKDFKKEGYTSLFNGKDLTGWKIPEGDNGHWKVIEGIIDYDARSEAKGVKHLITENSYKDFMLHVEWRLKEYSGLYPMNIILPDGNYACDTLGKPLVFKLPNSDSGVLLKNVSNQQINIWCWPVGSGELWRTRLDKTLPPEERAAAVPKFHADNPLGEWNTFDITLKGERVTVYLNDILVIENCLMPGLPETGPVGLQHHGGPNKEGVLSPASALIQFRNIWIKEI